MIPKRGQLTIYDLQNLKGKRQIIETSAIDFWTARAAQAAGVDIIATGSTGGDIDTYENLAARVQLIRKAAPNVLIMVPLITHTPLISNEEAIRGAVTLIRAGADIIGAGESLERVATLAKLGIPCHSHVGLVPNVSTWIGGLRAVGKNSKEALKVYKDALAYQEAGAIMIEMECVPDRVAAEITKRLDVPVISIGSGSGCDGQLLFSSDILGTHQHLPRHAKKYRDFFEEAVAAFKEFKDEAQSGAFPTRDKLIDIKDEEFEFFMEGLEHS
ncbi:3-methyl-2-oxobutanoate hydroxymethyltransferase [Chloroflexota bacterium]